MIAEKPSIAKAIADALSNGRAKLIKKSPTPIHSYYGYFKSKQAKFRITSVTGHLYKRDFGN